MPDADSNACRQSEVRFRKFDQFMADSGTTGKEKKNVKSRSSPTAAIDISSIGDVTNSASESGSPPPDKKARAKESSRFFGVRFRPDLQKWVAEIRVFEWKSVDKKVWLGTFDSELGAACAVDAARKLLKCQKKRDFNFPCAELTAYNESIPAHVRLTNVADDGMFKEVTLFVKRKAQEYAAGLFGAGRGATAAVGLREQLVTPQTNQIQVGVGNGCFQLTSDSVEPSRQLFAVPEDDVFPCASSYGSTGSYGSYVSQLPSSCEGVTMSQHWRYLGTVPTSITYSTAPSSCSSEGTSPEDRSWVQVQPSMSTEEALQEWSQEAQIDGDYCVVPPCSWEDHMPMPMAMDDQTIMTMGLEGMEYLFSMEDSMEDNQEDQAIDPIMNIFLADEEQRVAQVMYTDNQYGSWTFHQSFANSFENKVVC